MRILRVLSTIDPRAGGTVEAARSFDIKLLDLGHDVEILTSDLSSEIFIKNYPAKVHALGPAYSNYRYNPKLASFLKRYSVNYDAVIVDGLWQYHSFSTWRALRKSETPYFVFTHGMLDPWFKKQYPLKHFKKWLYWPWAEYQVLRDARAVIFTCEEERLLARESFWLYQANEAVASLGIASPPKDAKILAKSFLKSHPELRGKRIVLFLSRIHEKKGCDLLIEAFNQIAKNNENVHIVMAGPDQTGWASTLKNRAQQLGISDRITWPGMLQGDAKWGAYYSAEVFCLPSHQENFGMVVAEAMACAKPVLISNKVNIWREIASDQSGYVDDDTIAGTLRNLQRWLDLDTEAYKRMSERANQCFSQRFSIHCAAVRLADLITINTYSKK